MPEPFKNLYNPKLINSLAREIKKEYPSFNTAAFKKKIFNRDWDKKELKERMRHISEVLRECLPPDYQKALKILRPIAARSDGFEYMFFQDFVEIAGLDDWEASMSALEHFTKYASSEFAVRQFILLDEKRMMKQMLKWASSKNYHVRRLASEGSRSRLPWAVALPSFKKNPSPILPIIGKLIEDDSEYVRRSVANNLNDISKDNPDVTLKVAKKWIGKSKETDKLIKHACRTLLKAGHQEALELFGLKKPKHIKIKNVSINQKASIGKHLEFTFDLDAGKKQLGQLRIEYAVHFMRANGKTSKKVFKISESNFHDSKKTVNRRHSFKLISTRRYYPGKHGLSIILNGQDMHYGEFKLV